MLDCNCDSNLVNVVPPSASSTPSAPSHSTAHTVASMMAWDSAHRDQIHDAIVRSGGGRRRCSWLNLSQVTQSLLAYPNQIVSVMFERLVIGFINRLFCEHKKLRQ